MLTNDVHDCLAKGPDVKNAEWAGCRPWSAVDLQLPLGWILDLELTNEAAKKCHFWKTSKYFWQENSQHLTDFFVHFRPLKGVPVVLKLARLCANGNLNFEQFWQEFSIVEQLNFSKIQKANFEILTVWYLCMYPAALDPESLGMTLGTWALGVDRPLRGGETTSKCCCIFNLPDLGGGCGGTLKWPLSRLGGKGGGTEVGGKGVLEVDVDL